MRSARGTAALLLLALCALLGAAGPLVVYFSTEPREAHRWVDHSYAIIDRLQNLIAAVADAETGQRGYLLTHNTAYLEPYHAALAHIPRELDGLRRLTASEPAQAQRADALAALIQTKLARLKQILDLEEQEGLAAAVEAMRARVEHDTRRAIYDRATEMIDVEELLLKTRQAHAADVENHVVLLVLSSSIIALFCVYVVGRELRSRQRLKDMAEAADAAKARFIADLSHELRSPLTAIIGFAELLRGQAFGPLGHAKYAEYARHIQRAGEHLLDLINDILDVSKAAAGRLSLREERVDVAAVLENCAQMLMPQAESAGVALSRSVAPKAGAVWGDPKRLRQIVINLIANAVKYTPFGGRVTVEARREANGHLVIAVADTGAGIAETDLAKVFEPFEQVDNAINREGRGTGLGLPLAKRLVELHGGRLTLQSKAGAGTTAVVSLPAERVCRAA